MELKCCILVIFVFLVTSTRSQDCPNACTCTDGQKTMICRGLTSLPEAVDDHFTEFIFDNCNLQGEFPKMPVSYSHAHTLQIIHSNVESIADGAFEDMRELVMLSLRGNKIQVINSAKLFGLSSLLTIDLQGNQLTVIEDELFRHNPILNKVIFSDNPFTKINDRAFAQPENTDNPGPGSQIQYIELENCNLNTIPTAALCINSVLPNLVSLDLSHNDFSHLEEDLFEHTAEIEQLELDSCKIQKITKGTLAGLTKLKSLRLSNNILSAIDEESFADFFTSLNYIHLDYNKLTVVPYGLFNWAVVKVLNISNNPWECSCSNGWIQEYNVTPNDTNYNITYVAMWVLLLDVPSTLCCVS